MFNKMYFVKYCKDFFKAILVLLVFLLILDNILFYFPNLFPKDVVRFLSHKAQIRYQLLHPENIDVIYDEYIYYYRPNKYIERLDSTIDEFGYFNPPGYLKSSNIDVLLLGDSFAQDKKFTFFLRDFFPYTFYSMGIGGQSIFHWKYHFLRFKESDFYKQPPKFVILNYYVGNDIADTQRALEYINAGLSNSIYYPTNALYYGDPINKLKRKFSFYNELKTLVMNINRIYKIKYRLKNKLKNLFFDIDLNSKNKIIKNDNNLNSSENILNYSAECMIYLEPQELVKSNLFSEDSHPDIVNEIIKTIKIFNKKNTKIIFNFVPSTITIYADKLDKSSKYMFGYNMQRTNTENLKEFLERINITYIDLMPQIRMIAKTTPLHSCSGDNLHFNDEGNKIYAKLLVEHIMGMN